MGIQKQYAFTCALSHGCQRVEEGPQVPNSKKVYIWLYQSKLFISNLRKKHTFFDSGYIHKYTTTCTCNGLQKNIENEAVTKGS